MRNYRRSKDAPETAAVFLALVMPPGAEEKLVLPELRRRWAEVAGPVLAKKSFPEDIDKGELFIKADSPSSAKAVSMRGASMARQAARVGGIKITSVRVAVGRTSPHAPRASKRAPAPPVRVRREDLEEAMDRVKDKFSHQRQDVAKRLASLMAFYKARFPGR